MKRLIVIFCFLFPQASFADELPKVTFLKKGEIVPYDGTLLNSPAAAQIITDKKNVQNECALQTSYIVNREAARNDLLLSNVKIELKYNQQRFDGLLLLKDKEIERMTKLAEKGNHDYSSWWLAGGVIIGAAATIALYYAASAGK